MAVKRVEFTQEDERRLNEYRSQFIRLLSAQEADIDELTADLSNEIYEQVRRTEADEEKLSKITKVLLIGYFASVVDRMTKTNTQTAKIVLDQQTNTISELNNPDYMKIVRKETGNFVDDVSKAFLYRKWPGTMETVGSRIVSLQGDALKTVQDILQVSIDKGLSAKQIAEEIKNYMRPTEAKIWTSPFQWYRDRFGFKVSPNRHSGSLESNALRIARTEINQTYRTATIQFNANKPWIIGFNWVLSPSHPEYDICDEWADDSPYDADGSAIGTLGHPYCMCTVQEIIREFDGSDYKDVSGSVNDDYIDNILDDFYGEYAND